MKLQWKSWPDCTGWPGSSLFAHVLRSLSSAASPIYSNKLEACTSSSLMLIKTKLGTHIKTFQIPCMWSFPRYDAMQLFLSILFIYMWNPAQFHICKSIPCDTYAQIRGDNICLTFITLGLFSRWQIYNIFLYFLRKQDLTFHSNCLHWRQFAWCQILFPEKIKKNISKCRLLKILPTVLSINYRSFVSPQKQRKLWALIKSALARHFYLVPTMYVFTEK